VCGFCNLGRALGLKKVRTQKVRVSVTPCYPWEDRRPAVRCFEQDNLEVVAALRSRCAVNTPAAGADNATLSDATAYVME
jgi:hypothetical protein